MSDIRDLRGAAVSAALAAAEKKLPAALLCAKGAQNALDIALADGRLVVEHKNVAQGIHGHTLVAAQIRHFQNKTIIIEFDGAHDRPR